MTQRKTYASALTKEELIKGGITLISEEGYVFRGDKQVIPSINRQGYWMLNIYELDENGEKIKLPVKRKFKGCKNYSDTYIYKVRLVGLHRAMWAWFNNEVPEGYVVDHINNKHESIEDYKLDNLQLLTPAENLEKEAGESVRQLKCKLDRPLSYYEAKLKMYEKKYEEAKKDHDVELIHSLRGNLADTKARIRYWLSHQEEAERLIAEKAALEANNKSKKRAYHKKADTIKNLKAKIKNARAHYKAAKEEYGADDLVVLQLKSDWHLAIYDLNKYLADNYLIKTSFSSENEE